MTDACPDGTGHLWMPYDRRATSWLLPVSNKLPTVTELEDAEMLSWVRVQMCVRCNQQRDNPEDVTDD